MFIDIKLQVVYNEITLFNRVSTLPCLINQYALARLGYGKECMADIPVVDCDQCLQPVWENELYDGLCKNCNQNDLSGFFE